MLPRHEQNMRRWIAELRSGKYGQARKVLNDGFGNYCCLGVACEMAVRDGVAKRRSGPLMEGASYVFDGSGSDTLLPGSLGVELFGDIMPVIQRPCGCRFDVTLVNDTLQWTFEQIADGLEYTYLGVPYPEGREYRSVHPEGRHRHEA